MNRGAVSKKCVYSHAGLNYGFKCFYCPYVSKNRPRKPRPLPEPLSRVNEASPRLKKLMSDADHPDLEGYREGTLGGSHYA